MKIAILGSGGREHALTLSISKSKKIKKIFCIPGNAGTSELAENVSLDINNFKLLKNFLSSNGIKFVIVGPEKPLVDGVVDFLEKFGIKVFGPNKTASQLEGSKIFTKNLCKKYKIPTANYGVFNKENEAIKFLKSAAHPIVIKADNLASGKGVYICQNIVESEKAVFEIFKGKFGFTNKVLIEEFLVGEEMSYFIISDGKKIKSFETAQDHKRVQEGDKGKNTGGMGAYSPSRLYSKKLEQKILKKIIQPTIKGISDLGTKYKGFLYAGLMIVNDEPYLIEYNVRMGDPECQTILPKLKSDLFEIIYASCNENLLNTKIEWHNKKSLCIVLCSKGYPEEYKKNVPIKNIDKITLDKNDYCYHAGTKELNGEVYSVGGRVLNFVSLSDSFRECRNVIFDKIKILNWNEGFYRKDIGYKVIDE